MPLNVGSRSLLHRALSALIHFRLRFGVNALLGQISNLKGLLPRFTQRYCRKGSQADALALAIKSVTTIPEFCSLGNAKR
jgi:hypothetical protein